MVDFSSLRVHPCILQHFCTNAPTLFVKSVELSSVASDPAHFTKDLLTADCEQSSHFTRLDRQLLHHAMAP